MVTRIIFRFCLFFFLLSGCAGIFNSQINTIKENPAFYDNKKVTVQGQVVQVIALPFFDRGFCKIKDDTGEIWVKPSSRVPLKGNMLTIRGTVKTGIRIADKTFGIIVIEDDSRQ